MLDFEVHTIIPTVLPFIISEFSVSCFERYSCPTGVICSLHAREILTIVINFFHFEVEMERSYSFCSTCCTTTDEGKLTIFILHNNTFFVVYFVVVHKHTIIT